MPGPDISGGQVFDEPDGLDNDGLDLDGVGELALPSDADDSDPQSPDYGSAVTTAPSPVASPTAAKAPPVQAAPAVQPPPAVRFRSLGDIPATRRAIFDNTLAAFKELPAVENQRYVLSLKNLRYEGSDTPSERARKRAVLSASDMFRRLKGTYVLTDKLTGEVVGQRQTTLAHVPYLTKDGTIVSRGTEYTITHQQRLVPGIYTRKRDDGTVSAHVNVKGGLGQHIELNPATESFSVRLGTTNAPLFPLLKLLGASEQELRAAVGDDLYASNVQDEAKEAMALNKLFGKLSARTGQDVPDRKEAIRAAFDRMELDPDASAATLGRPFAKVDKDALLAAVKNVLAVSRGEREDDDRDAAYFQRLVGPEDIFAEQVARNRRLLNQALFKATRQGSLKSVPVGLFTKAIRGSFLHTGLGNVLEEVNPAEIFDQHFRVTRMGRGGIPSVDSIPESSRAVSPTTMGFLDLVRTAESEKVGVDLRLAAAGRKGSDGRLYVPVRAFDKATKPGVPGGEELHSAFDLRDKIVALPGEVAEAQAAAARGELAVVTALRKGKILDVPLEEVDYDFPDVSRTFSPLANLIPLKSASKPHRMIMGAKMLTQALPLERREAPLVQSLDPNTGLSFEQLYGEQLGALRYPKSGKAGVVASVAPDEIVIKDESGKSHTIELHNNFPMNRKTLFHQTPLVRTGDQVSPGQLLAVSNFTDSRGETALGTNARVAYMVDGFNHEDAFSISQSFANKTGSEQGYQHSDDWEANNLKGRRVFQSVFPAKYTNEQLSKFDDQGLIRPGTVVKQGDPLVLRITKMPPQSGRIRRGPSFRDSTVVWEHETPGIVTDSVTSGKGFNVVVKSVTPSREADKLSNLFGGKGVISRVIPDDEMPVDEDGKPFDILINPLGLNSRTNPNQILATALGKIAEKDGKPVVIKDFDTTRSLSRFVFDELKKRGLKMKSTVYLPKQGRHVPGIYTGNQYFLKLHHLAEAKAQGRGIGDYDVEEQPAKGGGAGKQSKRLSYLETMALLSHGAIHNLRDSAVSRGQANPQFWLQYMAGYDPPVDKVPHVYEKWLAELQSAGIHPVRKNEKLQLMALTDKDVDELAGDRNIESGDLVKWQRDSIVPVPGGLFDTGLTGGVSGNRWAAIALPEPLPNPVFEEPIRRVLGLTGKQFEAVMSGQADLGGGTGPSAIAHALAKIDLPKEIAAARAEIKSGRKSRRDDAVKRLSYLASAEKLRLHPKDWVLNRLPVLPPRFRPVSVMVESGTPLIADANLLYQEVLEAKQARTEAAKTFGQAGDETLQLYKAVKAVTGLGDPIKSENAQRQVKGALRHVFGSSPKFSMVQRKLLSRPVDLVGRAVIAPDPRLSMDEVGLPEDKAWEIYTPFVVRRLVRRGVPGSEAAKLVEERKPEAKKELIAEMGERPVMYSRAPVLHKYGIIAGWPKLIRGNAMRLSPLVLPGMAADADGDALNFHVPFDKKAALELAEKLLPSRNLISAADMKRAQYRPTMEYIGGLYHASTAVDREQPPVTFDTAADAIAAFKRGEYDLSRRVIIRKPPD